jgi:hypothetical protein
MLLLYWMSHPPRDENQEFFYGEILSRRPPLAPFWGKISSSPCQGGGGVFSPRLEPRPWHNQLSMGNFNPYPIPKLTCNLIHIRSCGNFNPSCWTIFTQCTYSTYPCRNRDGDTTLYTNPQTRWWLDFTHIYSRGEKITPYPSPEHVQCKMIKTSV